MGCRSMAAAVATMWISSTSSLGAITIMLGTCNKAGTCQHRHRRSE